MNSKDYATLLLDASFKESGAFWNRNTAFLVTQGAFAGFYLKDGIPDSGSLFLTIVAGMLGLALSVAHFAVLKASHYYNKSWLASTLDFARIQMNTEDSSQVWAHFVESVEKHEKAPYGHSTSWAMILPIAFGGLWISTVIYVVAF